MGTTNTTHYTERQNTISLLFKALGHPARIAIVEYLVKVRSCVTGEIVKELPLAQPTVSQHLKELKNAGLIQGTIEGTSICYCINPEYFQLIELYFQSLDYNFSEDLCCD